MSMIKIKIAQDRQILPDLFIRKDMDYEVLDIVGDTFKIAIPMKRKGKYKYALVSENEGELVD